MQAHATGAERGGRSTKEVTNAAAQLTGYLDEQRVIGELPEILMKLLVQFVHEGKVLLLGSSRHAVHERLEIGAGCRSEPAPQAPDHELLEHDPQARDLLEHPRRQAGHPGSP